MRWDSFCIYMALSVIALAAFNTGCAALPSSGIKNPIQQDLTDRQSVELTQPLDLPAWPHGAVAMTSDTGTGYACFAAPQAKQVLLFAETAKANQVIANALYASAIELNAEAQQLSLLANELNVAAEPEILTLERLGWLAIIFTLVVP